MMDISKENLVNEIETTLCRKDISQKDFVILHSLKYLLEELPLDRKRKVLIEIKDFCQEHCAVNETCAKDECVLWRIKNIIKEK